MNAAAPSSMTGFAQVRQDGPGGVLTLSLKTLNHRYLDLRWQVPAACEPMLPELEKRVRAALHRGHVEVRIHWRPAVSAATPRLDEAQVEAWLAAFRELARRLGASSTPAVAELMRVPGIFTGGDPAGDAEAGPEPALVQAALDAALRQLAQVRQAEGAALALSLQAPLDGIARLRGELAALQPELEAAARERLRRRLAGLLEGALPEERLLQEAALLAERADVSEELERLEIHLAQCRATLAAGGECGKRLDFLAQELARESNTLLSKSAGATPPAARAAPLALDLKATIEKFREQIQNLE